MKLTPLTTRPPVTSRQGMMRLASTGKASRQGSLPDGRGSDRSRDRKGAICRCMLSYNLQEIADDLEPHGAGLFGVELDAVHVAAFERGGVTDVVGAGGAGTGVFGHVVAVREVHVRAGVQIVHELRTGAHFELVPAHVGNARTEGEAPHGAGVDAEAADFRGLFAGIEQRLHAEADAEKGHAGLNAFDQRRAHAQRIQGAHHLAEMAHSGENDFGSSREAGGVVDNGVVAAQFAKGVLHAAQIARALIEDGNHKSSLVEGSCPLRRASLEQANFMARAKHLKMASSLWWLERPYNTLACRLAPASWTTPRKKPLASSVCMSPPRRTWPRS